MRDKKDKLTAFINLSIRIAAVGGIASIAGLAVSFLTNSFSGVPVGLVGSYVLYLGITMAIIGLIIQALRKRPHF